METISEIDEVSESQIILENGFRNGRTNYRDLLLVAKYYRWSLSYKTKRIEKELIDFCVKNDKYFNRVLCQNLLDVVIKQSAKYKLRIIMPVQITKAEIESIRNVKNFTYQKLLFVMLAVAKELKFNVINTRVKSPQLLGYTVSNNIMKAVLAMAGLNISQKKFLVIAHDFYNLNLVEPTYTNTLRLLFVDNNSQPVITVDNFTNIVKYYTDYLGGEIGFCSRCDNEFIKTSNRQKFCKLCAIEDKREKTRNRVRKHRNK